ncbi:MAG: hypothetical protein JW724_07160 [Candidatus Altiarchaeota archaeon]|nr:hypothetical protein [Candidatus Altiarchaeota archaeon]
MQGRSSGRFGFAWAAALTSLCILLLAGGAFACEPGEVGNDTLKSLTINESLAAGDYYWWVNCSSAGVSNVSGIRIFTASISCCEGEATNATAKSLTINESLSGGNYSWWINCSSAGVSNVSGVRYFTLVDTVVSTPLTFNSSLSATASFTQGQEIRIRVNVTDSDGASGIDKAVISLILMNGSAAVSNASMTNISSIANGRTYEYNYTIPAGDSYKEIWTVNVYANDTAGQISPSSTAFGVDKSEVNNTGITSFLAYMLLTVELNDSGTWTHVATVVNDTSPRSIPFGTGLALDVLWWDSGAWNTTDNSGGRYRVYAALMDNAGNVLRRDDGSWMNASYIFNITVVANEPPVVNSVVVNDSDGGGIQLSVNDDRLVYCNASITDVNGWQDVATGGGANATLYHNVSSNATAADDKNVHYTNSSCSFTDGDGNNVTAVCAFTLEHEALNGTWMCNVTAWDQAAAQGDGAGNNSIDQLLALEILEDGISFGSMNVGESSSVANSTNITNKGNVFIDIRVKGNADLSCSGIGSIGIGNLSFNLSAGSYASMSANKLSTSYATETEFDLGIEGIATPEDAASTKNEYWTINIPQGVYGTCNNTITVGAILSEAAGETVFYVDNESGDHVAAFSDTGSIVLRGVCIPGGDCGSPPDGSFIFQDPSGTTVSYIDGSGNLCIQDESCSFYDSDCGSPGDGSFIVQNSAGTNVAYINSTGNMCLMGALTQGGNP